MYVIPLALSFYYITVIYYIYAYYVLGYSKTPKGGTTASVQVTRSLVFSTCWFIGVFVSGFGGLSFRIFETFIDTE